LKPRWERHLQYLMRVARKIDRIGDDELEAGCAALPRGQPWTSVGYR
jgi:hypothetical protein